jgi:charged multivesicular body protein 6
MEQEVSEIIGGRISVQDEEEVEDELAALEAEVGKKERAQRLPSVPDTQLPAQNKTGEEGQVEQAGRTAQTERQAMLA